MQPNSAAGFYARTVSLATLAILAVVCLRILTPFATAMGWAIFFAFLLHPIQTQLRRRLGRHKQHATLLLTLGACIALLGPLAWLSTLFVVQASSLLNHLQNTLSRDDLMQLIQQPLLQHLFQWLQDNADVTTTQLRTWASDGTRLLLQSIAAASGHVFLGALGTIANLFLTLFLMFFFLRDGAAMLTTLRELIPMSAETRNQLFAHLSAVTRAVVYGTGLTALIQGTLVGLAFLFAGLPSPVVFGVLAVLLALLPTGGTALLWLPAALILLAQHQWGAGIFMLLWGALLVSMIDNFLKPLLISGRAEVATLTIFLGVLGGVSAFGAIGLFLGPVVLALALALIRFTVSYRQQQLSS